MPVYNESILSPGPLYVQTGSYDARSDRKWFSDIASPGIVGVNDYLVTYSGALLTMTIAGGIAWVLGGNISDQGMYRQYIASSVTVNCPTADATNPRIDTVILRAMDNAADASGFNEGRIEIVPGTATAGATLANLTGKNPLTSLGEASRSFTVLAYVLVPAGATTLTNTATNVKDARTRAGIGGGSIPLAASSTGTVKLMDYTVPVGGVTGIDSNTILGGNIPQTYTSLRMEIALTETGAGSNVTGQMNLNADATAAHYYWLSTVNINGAGTSGSAAGSTTYFPFDIPGSTVSTQTGFVIVEIPFYSNANFKHAVYIRTSNLSDGAANWIERKIVGSRNLPDAITRIALFAPVASFAAGGRVTIWGIS